MRENVTTVEPDESLYAADRLMSRGDLRHLPVLRGTALVGILTPCDILRAPGRFGPALEFGANRRAALRELRVEDAMTKSVVTIGPDASVNEAVEQLLKHRVECLPVLENGRLVGMFTATDLLHAIAGPREGVVDPREARPTATAQSTPSYIGSAA